MSVPVNSTWLPCALAQLSAQQSPQDGQRKKSAQLTKLQGSVDALLQQNASPRVDVAYTQALDNLISIIGGLVAAKKAQ